MRGLVARSRRSPAEMNRLLLTAVAIAAWIMLAPAGGEAAKPKPKPAVTVPLSLKELYRTETPIPDLKPGTYDLNLTRVTFPVQRCSLLESS